MERAIKFEIPYDKDIINTIEGFNEITNFCLRVGFESNTFNKNDLHKLTYYEIRGESDLQSSLVCCARDQASEMLKREKLKRLPFKKEFSSIRYNQRTFSFKDGIISLSTIEGRKKIVPNIPKYFSKYLSGEIKSIVIFYKNNRIFGRMITEVQTPDKIEVKNVLGIDRGIINPVVTSNNQFFNSKNIRRVKGKYTWLKAKLQSKGTRSAKRHLRKLSGREKRFVPNANHILSKTIVNMPFEAFALERLKVRRTKKQGRKFNKKLGTWAFKQFQTFLEYKAENLGKTIVLVNCRYTSQVCSNCGYHSKSNRKGIIFKCLKCSFSLHSDLNASRNITELGKALFSRLSVNEPIVASFRQLQAT